MGILIIYFIIGAILDILSIVDFKAVQHFNALRSALVSFIASLLSWACFYYIITSPEVLSGIIAYSLGGAVGTYALLKSKRSQAYLSQGDIKPKNIGGLTFKFLKEPQ